MHGSEVTKRVIRLFLPQNHHSKRVSNIYHKTVRTNGRGRGAKGLYAKENPLKIFEIMGVFASRGKAENWESFVDCKL